MSSNNTPVKVTIVTSYYPPDFTSLSNYYKDIAEDLAEYGARVTLVCGIPTRLVDAETTKRYAMHPVEQVNDNLRIIRTGPKKSEGKNLARRAVYHVYRSLCVYKKAKTIETDIYFICSAPPFLGYFNSGLSKRAKTIYDLQDMFPDSLVGSGKRKERSLLVKFLRKFEKYVYKHSAHIRVISKDMGETLKSRGVSERKISVIYNWVDETVVTHIGKKDNPMFDSLQIPRDSFCVGYAGNIGLLQNLSTMISAAEILEKQAPQIKFLIIGDGAWKPEMMKRIQEKNLKNVLTRPMQDTKHVPCIYNLADIGIVTIGSGVTKGSMPSKTWNILSAARPVICEADKGSELERIITENECGICVAPGDADELANAVLTLYNDKELREEMGKNGRAYIESTLTRRESTKKIMECIMKVYKREPGINI